MLRLSARLIGLCLVSERGGLLRPDHPRRRHDSQLAPGIKEVLLCDHGDGLPPHHAGQLPQGQGPVPLPLLPGLQSAPSGPSEPGPSPARVPSWRRTFQPQTGAHLWGKLGGPLPRRLICPVL